MQELLCITFLKPGVGATTWLHWPRMECPDFSGLLYSIALLGFYLNQKLSTINLIILILTAFCFLLLCVYCFSFSL